MRTHSSAPRTAIAKGLIEPGNLPIPHLQEARIIPPWTEKPAATRRSLTRLAYACSSTSTLRRAAAPQTSSLRRSACTRTRCAPTCSCSKKPGSPSPPASNANGRAARGGYSPPSPTRQNTTECSSPPCSLLPWSPFQMALTSLLRRVAAGATCSSAVSSPARHRTRRLASPALQRCYAAGGSPRKPRPVASSCTAARSATWPSASRPWSARSMPDSSTARLRSLALPSSWKLSNARCRARGPVLLDSDTVLQPATRPTSIPQHARPGTSCSSGAMARARIGSVGCGVR